MRKIGTQATGIRLPIISKGDDLPNIVVDSLLEATEQHNIKLNNSDVVCITEAIVAKAQGNYVSSDDIASDVAAAFPDGTVGVVFPILSRNRFLGILKGIVKGASKRVIILLEYPSDEVGNPSMDISALDDLNERVLDGEVNLPIKAAEFRKLVGSFSHPFTGVDYTALYEGMGSHIEVYFSRDARDILRHTKNIIICEVHKREHTRARLMRSGAEKVLTLAELCTTPGEEGGYNPEVGLLGSNLAGEGRLKLFPREGNTFVASIQSLLREKTGVAPEVMIYGDGAFKDPAHGIWELADPTVSPGHTPRLAGQPNEIKLKYVSDNLFSALSGEAKREAVIKMIREKPPVAQHSEGTTPRKISDLLGSLCDLMSGSGDKGTPVVLVQGYFDDYSVE